MLPVRACARALWGHMRGTRMVTRRLDAMRARLGQPDKARDDETPEGDRDWAAGHRSTARFASTPSAPRRPGGGTKFLRSTLWTRGSRHTLLTCGERHGAARKHEPAVPLPGDARTKTLSHSWWFEPWCAARRTEWKLHRWRLDRRHGGQQLVRVEHVHVSDGGQAVIANVRAREGDR
jgi:hypothetical protein